MLLSLKTFKFKKYLDTWIYHNGQDKESIFNRKQRMKLAVKLSRNISVYKSQYQTSDVIWTKIFFSKHQNPAKDLLNIEKVS